MTTPLPPLLLRGDCLHELRRIPDASVDAIVTDPPYGLSDLRPQRIAQAIAAWTVAYGARNGLEGEPAFHDDSGGASRFFYVAKAPKSERPSYVDENGKTIMHATVKPLALMRWLVRLVTPPGGCVVDPFAGSGTTGEAAYLEGFESILIEMTPDYWPLIQARIDRVTSRG